MSEYYALLRILRKKLVLPLALVRLPRSGGVRWRTYTERLFGHEVLCFRYGQIGIRDLISEAYLIKENPVPSALSVLMTPATETRAVIKLSALHNVVDSDLQMGDKLFLVELINTYLPTAELTGAKEEIMKSLAEIEMTWGEKLRMEGRMEGEVVGMVQ
jgi:hypothetical protein